VPEYESVLLLFDQYSAVQPVARLCNQLMGEFGSLIFIDDFLHLITSFRNFVLSLDLLLCILLDLFGLESKFMWAYTSLIGYYTPIFISYIV